MTAAGERILKRVEMWCARHWIEARTAGLAALAEGNSALYCELRSEENDWFGAMLAVNRLFLGIEPLRGETFLDDLETPSPSKPRKECSG